MFRPSPSPTPSLSSSYCVPRNPFELLSVGSSGVPTSPLNLSSHPFFIYLCSVSVRRECFRDRMINNEIAEARAMPRTTWERSEQKKHLTSYYNVSSPSALQLEVHPIESHFRRVIWTLHRDASNSLNLACNTGENRVSHLTLVTWQRTPRSSNTNISSYLFQSLPRSLSLSFQVCRTPSSANTSACLSIGFSADKRFNGTMIQFSARILLLSSVAVLTGR